MFQRLWENHRKACTITGIVAGLILVGIYLNALFQPGVWYGDAFLYRQKDSSYAGYDMYADYQMVIDQGSGEEIRIDFRVNDTAKQYRILQGRSRENVEIYEGDTQIFRGSAVLMDDYYWLVSDDESLLDDTITFRTSNWVPEVEELFPGNSQLYNWAVMKRTEIRGNLAMPVIILIGVIILTLDIAYPDLFFTLKYHLAVDGGEPSDWYRFTQKVGRVVMIGAILVLVVMTFTVR